MRRIETGTAGVAVAVLAVACALVAIDRPPASAETRTIVDSAGRRVEVPARIERVFAAGPPATVLVYTVAPDKLLGWYRPLTLDERAFIPERYLEKPTLGKLTGRSNTPNLELVRTAKPDVILDYGAVGPHDAALADRLQKETGVPYLLIDGRLAATPRAYRMIGDLLGVSGRAEELARYAERALADVETRVARVPAGARPGVYYARAPRGLQTEIIETIEALGARNVADGTIERGPLVPVTLDQVVGWDPDVIVTIDREFAAAVRADPAWQAVKAVRDGRIYKIPPVPWSWLDLPPSANRLLGLRWLGRALYPALFPEDLRAEARRFYALFYHRAPDDAQLDALLDSR